MKRLVSEYRRRTGARTLFALLLLSLTVGMSVLLLHPLLGDAGRPDQTRAPVPEGGLTISFGAGRAPLTRTMTLQSQVMKGRAHSPSAFLIRLESDLVDAETGRQFPAQQVTVAASEVAGEVLALTVSADPWSPERVAAGIYRGRIAVINDDSRAVVPLVLVTTDRSGASAWLAFLILVAGASAGLLIKWIAERLTPHAMIYRRLAALHRSVGWDSDGRHLPIAARLRVEELQDVIARQDFGRAEQLFTELETKRELLASMSSGFSVLYDLLSAQARAINTRREPVPRNVIVRVDSVLDECHRRLRLAQAAPWLEEAEQTVKDLDTVRLNFVTASQVITSFLNLPNEATLRNAIDLLQRGEYDGAAMAYDRFLQSGTVETSESVEPARSKLRRSVRLTRAEEPPLSPWFRLARPIAGAASVLVVALVGLKMQYLDSQLFQGDLTAWVTLGLWGFVIELSGTSVIEVVSRLGSHGTGHVAPATRV